MHDSGAERVLVADVAERLGVPFAPLSATTTERLAALLDPGSSRPTRSTCGAPAADTEDLLADCLTTLADDPAVDVVALAVDLVPEYDGDESFPKALAAARSTTPTSRWSCWRTCPPRSTGRSRPTCGRGASRCSREPAPACVRWATCSTTRPARPSRRRTVDEAPAGALVRAAAGRGRRRRSRCSPTTASRW